MTQLKENQISSLFDFVKSKYVRYIDVQHELVDHLASDIEFEMKSDSSLTFENALQKVYAKFPISGFSKFVSNSEAAMNKFWAKLIWNEIIIYHGIPLLLMLLSLITIQYYLMLKLGAVSIIAILLIAVILNFGAIKQFRLILKSGHNTDESYLVITVFKSFTIGITFMPVLLSQLTIDLMTYSSNISNINYKLLGLAILLSLNFIWSAMTYYRFPYLIRQVLNDKYAHLKLSV